MSPSRGMDESQTDGEFRAWLRDSFQARKESGDFEPSSELFHLYVGVAETSLELFGADWRALYSIEKAIGIARALHSPGKEKEAGKLLEAFRSSAPDPD
jgi:hypothetical protein